jgi:hypothetical protein
MGVFDEREKAQENKYFHDADLKFKAVARRDKLFGQWAASQLALSGKAADDYALTVVKSDLEEPGDDDILRKVAGDLKAIGRSVPEADLKKRLETFMAEAIKQLEFEKK